MAEFVPPPQIQQPNFLQSYLQGRMAPMQVQQEQQKTQAGALQLEQLRIALRNQQMTQQYAQQLAGQAAGAQNGGTPTGGIQNGPQGSVSQPQQDMPQVNTMMALDVLAGRDPLATAQKAQEYQRTQKQIAAQGPLALAETVASSDQADVIIKNNPALQQAWIQNAPKLGLDPFKDLTPENARKVSIFAYNNIAGDAGLPIKPMPVQMQDVAGPLNSLSQRNPVTNELKTVRGEEGLHQVIGANGQPQLLPASQAAGKQPFNQSIFGAANMSDNAIQLAADTYRTTGKLPASMGRNPAMQAKILEKVAADAAASGDTVGAIAARQASLKANNMALDQNSKLLTATSGYAETLEKNLNNLVDEYKKLGGSDSPLVNKGIRAWQQGVSGDPQTAKVVTWLNAVQGEYAKLKSGSLGNAPATEGAMKDAKEVINKTMSQGGVEAVAQAMRQEKDNRLSAIKEENARLLQALGQSAPNVPQPNQSAPKTNSKGWVLHTDKNGIKAYVSPDGKQYEELK